MWGDLLIGLQEALTWQHLGLMFLGTVWGFIGGALPGIQASTAMALILPITWGMSPSGALMMLAAVYVSAEYSHSVPAILIRTPGTSAAVVTPSTAIRSSSRARAARRSAYPCTAASSARSSAPCC